MTAQSIAPENGQTTKAKAIETAKRDHEHLLHEIVEVGAIAEHAIQVAGDLAAEAVVELVVRGALVGAATPDQLDLVGRPEGGQRGAGSGIALHRSQHSVTSES